MITALDLGQSLGVISILSNSIPRHLSAFGAMGIINRLAGDRVLGLAVSELANKEKCVTAMIETGKILRDADGANVIIMGFARMAEYRHVLEN